MISSISHVAIISFLCGCLFTKLKFRRKCLKFFRYSRYFIRTKIVEDHIKIPAAIFINRKRNLVKKPNVILISVDTLRYDALGVNGCEIENNTPNIDEFSRHSVNFKTCIAQASWTLPSHSAMLTSQYMSLSDQNKKSSISSSPTLAEIFKKNRYITCARVNCDLLMRKFGFSRGFLSYENIKYIPLLENRIPGFKKLIYKLKDSQFFIFLHTMGCHAPYKHLTHLDLLLKKNIINNHQKVSFQEYAKGCMKNFYYDVYGPTLRSLNMYNNEVYKNLYLASVNHVDIHLGLLINYLKEIDLFDNTIIVLTGDHGEEFGEHSAGCCNSSHGGTLFEEAIRVPLIVHFPKDTKYSGKVVEEMVGSIDIMPTILSYLNIRTEHHLAGIDVLKYVNKNSNEYQENRTLFSLTDCSGWGTTSRQAAARTSHFKYIKNYVPYFMPTDKGFYDLKNDPKEERNLAENNMPECLKLEKQLEEFIESLESGIKTKKVKLNREEIERLKSLGYM